MIPLAKEAIGLLNADPSLFPQEACIHKRRRDSTHEKEEAVDKSLESLKGSIDVKSILDFASKGRNPEIDEEEKPVFHVGPLFLASMMLMPPWRACIIYFTSMMRSASAKEIFLRSRAGVASPLPNTVSHTI